MKMGFDFSELKGLAIRKYGAQYKCAAAIGLSAIQWSNRLHNIVPFKPDEITALCDPGVLDIPPEDIGRVFYTPNFLAESSTS